MSIRTRGNVLRGARGNATRCALVVGLAWWASPALAAEAPAAAPVAKPLPTIELDEKPAFPLPRHLEQKEIAGGVVSHQDLFDAGEKLFHTPFNGLDGVGMMRTVGGAPVHRFSAGPAGGGQPLTVGAQSCGACHRTPFAAGAGPASANVFFDEDRDGLPPFATRNTTSLFGNGLLQLLAQEMTEELQAERDALATAAKKSPGTPATAKLTAKGVDFGTLSATADAAGQVAFDPSGLAGVDPDLVIRAFGWKGGITTLRNFQVLPATFGLGMMAEEFVWRLPEEAGADPDGDGVVRELSVGDITALTLYNAMQETPESVQRLAATGMVAAPDSAALERVERGRSLFAKVGCASCHRPEMQLSSTVFEEPTLRGNGHFLDGFLASKSPDYDPARAVKIDLATEGQPPRVEAAPAGGAVVRLYGDLKRHDMGRQLAEVGVPGNPLQATLAPVKVGDQPVVIPASVFRTPELWGVGNTGPWLHDGRAGTLAEAIALHGEDAPPAAGEAGRSAAQEARDAYLVLAAEEQAAVVSFLKSLVNFSPDPR